MLAQEWRRLEELYHAAIELAPEQRDAFLEENCAGDPNLRGRVISLILSSEDSTSFIESAVGAAAHSVGQATALANGHRIGPYEVVKLLGEGGMGCVYLATRVDKEYRKEVAIKVVRLGLNDPGLLSRFRAERQILAHLDHPNIARLIDGGVTASGSPYVVMEYVDGVHIDEYVAAHALSVAARLQLYRTVCSAISFAHRNLVIHRDIKPNNILVSADGTVKLLDFGIAKLQEAGSLGITAPMTRAATRLFTPEYASPEQVCGEVVTTATDVYSLGALLYRLLTNVPPHDIRTLSPAQIERTISGTEPLKPSVAAEQNGLPFSRELAGDIDTIVLTALHKDPARRYASVDRLDEDIRRYLEGFPIQARPETAIYRAQKFLGRHRMTSSLAAILILVMIASLIGLSIFAKRLARERDMAAQEQARAEQVSSFLIDLFKVSDPSRARGNSITAREVLDRGADNISRGLANQPKTKAAMLDTLGEVYGNLGLLDRSVALFEASLATRQRSFSAGDPELAQSNFNLARSLFNENHDYDRVEALARKSLEARRKHFGDHSNEVADSLELLGNLAGIRAKFSDAEPLLQQSYQIKRDLFGEDSLQTAGAIFDLANLEDAKNNLAGAETLFQKVLRIREKFLDPNDPLVLGTLEPVGYFLERKGDFDGAEKAYRRVLNGRRKMLPAPNPDIATALDHLASVLERKGGGAELESMYLEAIDNDRRSLGEWNLGTATIINNFAEWLRVVQRYKDAETRFRECGAIYAKVVGEEHPYTATAYDNLAMTLVNERRLPEAEQWELQALAIRRKRFGENNAIVARSLNHLGHIREERGNMASAENLYQEAYQVSHKVDVANKSIRGATEFSLGALLAKTGRAPDAEPLLREAFRNRMELYGADAEETGEVETALGGCLAKLKRFADAQPHLLHGYQVLRAKRGDQFEATLRARKLLDEYLQANLRPLVATKQ